MTPAPPTPEAPASEPSTSELPGSEFPERVRFTDRGFRWEQIRTAHPGGGGNAWVAILLIGWLSLVVCLSFVLAWFIPYSVFFMAPVVSVIVVATLGLFYATAWRPEPGGVELEGRIVRIREHDLVFELDLEALQVGVDERRGCLELSEGGEVFNVFPGSDLDWLATTLQTAAQRWRQERAGALPEPDRRALDALRVGGDR